MSSPFIWERTSWSFLNMHQGQGVSDYITFVQLYPRDTVSVFWKNFNKTGKPVNYMLIFEKSSASCNRLQPQPHLAASKKTVGEDQAVQMFPIDIPSYTCSIWTVVLAARGSGLWSLFDGPIWVECNRGRRPRTSGPAGGLHTCTIVHLSSVVQVIEQDAEHTTKLDFNIHIEYYDGTSRN